MSDQGVSFMPMKNYLLTLFILGLMALFILGVVSIIPAAAQTSTAYMTPTWSPDGKWLAFTQMNITDGTPRKFDADIYLMKTDGSGLKRLTGDGSNEFNPVFSKDGKSLFFSVADPQTRNSDLYSLPLDSSQPKLLKTSLNHPSAPEVSPDGKLIVLNGTLTAEAGDHFPQIYVMKADGTGLKQLTYDGKLAFYSPTWSPDGKRILYYLERGDNKDQIWSMKADGTDNQLLTANIGHNFYPTWTTDGKRVIFTSNRDGKQQLYIMNTDGTDVKPFGIEAGSVRMSPDGKRIVYTSGRFPTIGIYIANADGSNPVKLLPRS
jgi:Tol biopolymer transport system component